MSHFPFTPSIRPNVVRRFPFAPSSVRRAVRRGAALAVLAAAGALLGACDAAFIQTVEPTPTLITRTESVRQRPMAPVTRGQLIEAIRTTARVEALERAELFFKTDGRLKVLRVTQGDVVEEGDVLAELETGRLESDIESSQESLSNAELRLDAARTRARDERAAAQRAVANAELSLEERRTEFDRLLRRATPEQTEALNVDLEARELADRVDLQEVQSEAALFRAQRAVIQAEQQLAEIEAAGVVTRAQAVAQARADLNALRAALATAEESLRAREAGTASTAASPQAEAQQQVDAAVTAVSTAEAALAAAQRAHQDALDALDESGAAARADTLERLATLRLDIGAKQAQILRLEEILHEVVHRPTPSQMLEAEQALESAGLARDDVVRSSSRASTQAKQRAELDYQAAQRQFNEAIQPATPAEIATARANLDRARAELTGLQRDLTDLLAGETDEQAAARLAQEASAAAEAKVTTAAANLAQADQRLRDARSTLAELLRGGSAAQAVQRLAAAIRVDQGSGLAAARARVQAANAAIDQFLRGQGEDEAIERHAAETLASRLNALPAAQAALRAAQADVQAAQGRLDEVTRPPSDAELRVALNNEVAAQLEFEAAVENFGRIERGESATDFELQILENDVERSRIALDALLSQSEDNVIRAPFDGEITFTRGRTGSQVRAFNEIIGISDPSQLIVEVRVAEEDFAKMSVGQRAEVALDAFPGVKFEGSISSIPRTIVTQTGQTVRIPNATIDADFAREGIRMGMLARVNITLQVKEDVMKIPLTALRSLNERTFVETIVNEQRRSLPIVTGIRSDSEIEVISGLDEGQMIFASP